MVLSTDSGWIGVVNDHIVIVLDRAVQNVISAWLVAQVLLVEEPARILCQAMMCLLVVEIRTMRHFSLDQSL